MGKKKIIILFLVVFIILDLGVLFAIRAIHSSKSSQSTILEPKKEAPELTRRPFFFLSPRSDGKALTIKVTNVPKNAKIEYEITYLTDGVTQGIIGQVIPEEGKDFYEREHIFGTCSKNVCKYDRNVEFGKWKASIETSENIYEIGGDFHLQKFYFVGGKIEFADKFTVDVPKGGFKNTAWTLSYQNYSLPSPLPSGMKVMFDPFSISTTGSLSRQAELTVRLPQIPLNTTLKIFFFDPNKNIWMDLGGKINQEEQTITAKIDSLGTFVVTSSSL